MKLNATGSAGVLLAGALAVGAFAAGTHLGPKPPAGHNLYRPVAFAPAHNPVVLASHPPKSAANSPAVAPDSTEGAVDDITNVITDGPGATFERVYELVKSNYVDPLPGDEKLAHGAASAMVASLGDPDSRFLEAPEVAEVSGQSQGEYHGIGAALAVRRIPHAKTEDVPSYTEYRLVILAPLPGSPAEKAGLKSGDVVTTLNGKWVYNDKFVYDQTKALKAVQEDPVAFNKQVTALQKKIDNSVTLSAAQTQLSDPKIKTFSLTLARRGEPKPISVTLTPTAATTVSPIVVRTLADGIGLIKINQFTSGADKDFAAALAGFGTSPKGLVIDLRDCPGGLLEVGTAIAAKLTSAPSLGYVETKGKNIQPITITPNAPASMPLSVPLVVLVNGGTANTAELLASTLQSQGAKLVGTPTFGDSSDVKLILLKDGSGFTMTVGKLKTASKQDFMGVGIKPDIAVPDNGEDPLPRAIGVLTGRVARVPTAPASL